MISVAKAVAFIEGSTALLRIGRFRIEKRAPLIHWEEDCFFCFLFCINRFSCFGPAKSRYENNCDVVGILQVLHMEVISICEREFTEIMNENLVKIMLFSLQCLSVEIP